MEILLASFSGVAILNSLAFGLYLITKREGLLKNRLLGLMLLAAGIRIGKSLIILLYPDVSDAIPAVGLIGMASMGPLIFFYTRSLANQEFYWIPRYLFHFLFAFAIGIVLLVATPPVIFWLYFLASVQLGGYLLASFKYSRVMEDGSLRVNWLRLLLLSVSVVWLVFTAQLFRDSMPIYLAGTVLSAALLYVMIFSAIQHDKIFAKVRSVEMDQVKLKQIKERLVQLMEGERAYLETDLTVARIAEKLKLKPYVVSQIINEVFKLTVPEFINGYRMKEAERILLAKEQMHLSIEAIAYECGFNTPSAFYTYFKKIHGVTPTEFKRKLLSNENNGAGARFV